MPYNSYGQWVDDAGYSPMPGAGMPSVVSDNSLGVDWNRPQQPSPQNNLLSAIQAIRQSGAGPRVQQPTDTVFTGHASERLPESQSVLSRVPELQRQLYSTQPGYSVMGNTIALDGYQPRQIPAGADASYPSRMAAANAHGPMSDDERHAKLMGYLQDQYSKGTLDAEQGSQLYTHVMGVDPLSYAANKRKAEDDARKGADDATAHNIKVAVEMDRRRKALLDEQAALGRSAGGLPEDILASFGRNTEAGAHANEYFNPGVDMGVDPNDPTGAHKIEKSGWRGIDPGTIARLREIRAALGMDSQPAFNMDAARARQAELRAKAGGGAAPGAPSPQGQPAPTGGVPPFGPFANQAFGDPATAPTPFLRDTRSNLNAIAPWLRAAMSLPGRVNSGIRSGLESGYNAADQYFGGAPATTPAPTSPPVPPSAHMALIGGAWRMVDAQGNVIPYGQ